MLASRPSSHEVIPNIVFCNDFSPWRFHGLVPEQALDRDDEVDVAVLLDLGRDFALVHEFLTSLNRQITLVETFAERLNMNKPLFAKTGHIMPFYCV